MTDRGELNQDEHWTATGSCPTKGRMVSRVAIDTESGLRCDTTAEGGRQGKKDAMFFGISAHDVGS